MGPSWACGVDPSAYVPMVDGIVLFEEDRAVDGIALFEDDRGADGGESVGSDGSSKAYEDLFGADEEGGGRGGDGLDIPGIDVYGGREARVRDDGGVDVEKSQETSYEVMGDEDGNVEQWISPKQPSPKTSPKKYESYEGYHSYEDPENVDRCSDPNMNMRVEKGRDEGKVRDTSGEGENTFVKEMQQISSLAVP